MFPILTDQYSNPAEFNTGSGEVVAMYVVCQFNSSITYPTFTPSYDYETYAPPSTNGNGGLDFIGMQRCTDCDSSPIADLESRLQAQGWSSTSLHQFLCHALSQ